MLRVGQREQGTLLLRETVEAEREHRARDPIRMADVLIEVTDAYLQSEIYTEAELYARELLELYQAELPPADWSIRHAQSLLGSALAGQQRFTEAEPLLLAAADGLMALGDESEHPAPEITADALRRVITFYEATQQPAEMEKWQARLAEME